MTFTWPAVPDDDPDVRTTSPPSEVWVDPAANSNEPLLDFPLPSRPTMILMSPLDPPKPLPLVTKTLPPVTPFPLDTVVSPPIPDESPPLMFTVAPV